MVMRTIKIGVPSGKAKMTLWENSDDSESFEIKSIKRGKPYVMAYGIKHYLTKDETTYLRNMLKILTS